MSFHGILRHITSKVAGRSHDQRFIVIIDFFHMQLIQIKHDRVFVGGPEGCRYHTASAVYDLVLLFIPLAKLFLPKGVMP